MTSPDDRRARDIAILGLLTRSKVAPLARRRPPRAATERASPGRGREGDAERLYKRLGWIKVASIPRYAAYPDGTLAPTTISFKELSP